MMSNFKNILDGQNPTHESDPALQLENILNTILVNFFIIDSNYCIQNTNIQMTNENLGSPSSIIGKPISSVFKIAGVAMEKTIRKVFETGHTIYIEIEDTPHMREPVIHQGKQNALPRAHQGTDSIFALAAYYALYAPDGSIKYVLATLSDITERKKTVIAQLKEKRMLASVMEKLPNEYFMVNLEGRFLRWNKQFEKALGYSTSAVSKLHISDVFIDQSDSRFWESFDNANRQKTQPVRCSLRRKDGTELNRFIIGSVESINDIPCMICMGITTDTFSTNKKGPMVTWSETDRMISQLETENLYLRGEVELEFQHAEIIGKSQSIKKVLGQVEGVAKTDSSVLIFGETGTGKELVARAIHGLSSRKERPMIKLNCASFPPDLIENELFGHEKGAFTGAVSRLTGRFEVADGSTLFLDEIGEMPVNLQAKLLRVLQEGEFERLGGTKTLKVDVRIIAATNQNLEDAIKNGDFRQDLYYRLNIFPILVPPLRDRTEDIPSLLEKFVKEFAEKIGRQIDHIPSETIKALKQYNWPGNIRELRNIIERAMILNKGSILHINLPKSSQLEMEKSMTLDEVHRQYIEVQKQCIISALKRANGKIRGENGASRILNIKPTTLESKMKTLGIFKKNIIRTSAFTS